MFYLHVKPLAGKPWREPLAEGTFTVGRGPDADVRLEEYGVSARHAEIDLRGGVVSLRDLGSRNGTFVNGRKVESVTLHSGDRILLGSVLVVLQEAVSDRIRLADAVSAESEEAGGPDLPQRVRSVMERAWVPADAIDLALGGDRAAGDRPESAERTARVLAIVREVLPRGNEADDPDRWLERVVAVLVSYTGAAGGALLERRPGADFNLRAKHDPEGRLEVSRLILDRAVETGVPVCVEDREAEGVGDGQASVCLPLHGSGGGPAAVYLGVPASSMPRCARRASELGPVTSVLAAVLAGFDGRASLERIDDALAAGAEIHTAGPGENRPGLELVAQSRAMCEAVDRLERFAGATDPVLLRGEAGTGREHAARFLHARTRAPRAAFLAVRTGGRDPSILVEELLGVEGVSEAGLPERRGRIERAAGGTVYVDEIAVLPPEIQEALADIAEVGRVARVGGERTVPTGVRIVAATTRSLEEAVRQGSFSERLYLLLSGAVVDIPPLRLRREDVIPLAQHFVRRFSAGRHKRIVGLSMDACRALRAYSWPGNVRELRDVISRAVILARDEIVDVDVIPLDIAAGRPEIGAADGLALAKDLPWKEAKAVFEKAYFQEILDASEGNIAKSSRRAGIARKNFYYKLRRLGLMPPR